LLMAATIALSGAVISASPAQAAGGQLIVPATGGVWGQVHNYCDDAPSGDDHKAVDISLGAGGPVLAAASGTVSRSFNGTSTYGSYVIIDHGNGWQTLYAHLARSSMVFSAGQHVNQGQRIAQMGNTGTSAVHLHFEVLKNGVEQPSLNSYFTCFKNVSAGTTIPLDFPGLTGGSPVLPPNPRVEAKKWPAGNVAYNNQGDPEIFAIGGNGQLYHNWFNQSIWTGWDTMGGTQTDVVVGYNKAGNEEVFAIGGGGAIFHRAFVPDVGWEPWDTLGGSAFTDISLGYNESGNIELFAIGGAGVMYKNRWSGTQWTGWENMGGSAFTKATVGYNAAGNTEVFAIGGAGVVYHNYFTPGVGWSGWDTMGGSQISQITVGHNSAGNAELFAIGANGVMYHNYFVPGTGWTGWISMGGSGFTKLAVGLNAENNQEVVAIGGGGVIYASHFSPGTGWTAWSSLGGSGSTAVSVARTASGGLEVFAVRAGGVMWHKWFVPGVGWSDWASLGGSEFKPW
jgi:murein DD-endopeptidase MepM/ murein hydrolase activator NlpD